MLKTVGLILIIASCAALGFYKSREAENGIRRLRMMKQMAMLLGGELRSSRIPLGAAFLEVSGKIPGNVGVFLREAARCMAANSGASFEEIFRTCGEAYLWDGGEMPREKEMLVSLGRHLGYLDLDMQLAQLKLYETEVDTYLEELLSELPARQKMYRSLGILGGVFLAVLLW